MMPGLHTQPTAALVVAVLALSLLAPTLTAAGKGTNEDRWADNKFTTNLWTIIRDGDTAELAAILETNADMPHVRAANGMGPLFWAYEYGRDDMVAMLLKGGAKPDERDAAGRIAASYARGAAGAREGDAAAKAQREKDAAERAARELARANGWEDTDLTTRLWKLISSGDVAGLRAELRADRGASQARSADGRGPLWWALEFKRKDMFEMLVAAGADSGARDALGRRPGETAKPKAAAGKAKPAAGTSTFPWKDTPTTAALWSAIHDGLVLALEDMLVANPNAAKERSADGRGALWWAYEHEQPDMVKLLLDAGADPEARDAGGKRPRDMAPKEEL